MIIAFDTKRLREICEDSGVAVKELGAPAAEALQQRLADLRAAESIRDLIAGNPRISGEANATLSLTLTATAFSIWTPNHVSPPREPNGHVDWARTRRLRLLEIATS